MKRARTFPEERADRSKGIRGAERTVSRAAGPPRHAIRNEEEEYESAEGKGRNRAGGRQRQDGGKRQLDGGDGERKRDKFIVF